MSKHGKNACADCFYSCVCSKMTAVIAEDAECKRYLSKSNVFTTRYAEGEQVYVVHNGLAYTTSVRGYQFTNGTVQLITPLGLIDKKDVYQSVKELRVSRPELFPRRTATGSASTARKK